MCSAKTTQETTGSDKVVIEIEEKDDSFQLNVKGLGAFRNLKKSLSALGCCCIPVSCKSQTAEKA